MLGIRLFTNDFLGRSFPGSLKADNLGAGVAFLTGVNRRTDLSVALQASYPSRINSRMTAAKRILLQQELDLSWRLTSSSRRLTPYLIAGSAFYQYRSYAGFNAGAGAGITLRIGDVFIDNRAMYHWPILGVSNGYHTYCISVLGVIRRTTSKKISTTINQQMVEAKPLSDSDGDGLPDSADSCVYVPGSALFHGCPDTDGDGIEDRVDACPSVFGFAAYRGCPIPDTDGDGLNDEIDSCVNEPGPSVNKGCPYTPKQTLELLNIAAPKIFFRSGSAELLPESKAVLDSVTNLLRASTFQLIIEGHTDNQGNPAQNDTLSLQRAVAVRDYLVDRGINATRFLMEGYGSRIPVQSNATEAGRAANRRVVFRLQ